MSDTDLIVQAVAEVLEVHQIEFIDWQVGWDCGCNERGYLPGMPTLTDALRHQAEVAVAAARPLIAAEAWDEGHSQGWSDAQEAHDVSQEMDRGDWPLCTPNPYRIEQEDQ